MTVYLDPWCHAVADTPEELHAAMLAIGARRSWFRPSPPHYDLPPRLRAAAISAGAVPLERDGFVLKLRELRKLARAT